MKTKRIAHKHFIGYTPYYHQRVVHKYLGGVYNKPLKVIVKSRRQVGKSTMIENELLRYAINRNKKSNICVSPTLKQSKKMYSEIVSAISGCGLIKSSNATDLTLTLVNESTISFKSAEQGDALRGFSVTGLLCVDEAAFIDDEIFYGMILPWVDVAKAPMLVTSTPKLKSGWFYEYFMKGLADKNAGLYKAIDWADEAYREDIDRLLPPETIEEYRKMLPKTIFETEYLGQFVDAGGGVFTIDRFWQPTKGESLYIGIDWASGNNGDKTAVVGLNERGEQEILEYWNDVSDPNEQIKRIARILRSNKDRIRKVMAEKNSIGDVFLKLLQKEVRADRIDIIPFDTTNDSKREIIENLAAAIGDGVVKLKDEKENRLEFQAYQAEITKSGRITFNGSFGVNDDIVMATAIANKARMTAYGSYMLRFV